MAGGGEVVAGKDKMATAASGSRFAMVLCVIVKEEDKDDGEKEENRRDDNG